MILLAMSIYTPQDRETFLTPALPLVSGQV